MRTLSLVILLVTVPAVALAQTNTAGDIDAVRKDARVHVGPLYMTPSILLKELGIDSNVFNAAGEQVSDFTFTIAPKLDAWVPVARRVLFQTTAATDLVWYSKYDSERSVDPQVGVRTEIYLQRITLFADGQMLNTRQRMNYEIDRRARYLQLDASGGAEVRLTPKFSIEAAWRQGETEFDQDETFEGTSLQRTLNRETRGYRTVARFRLTPLTTLALKYERQRDAFDFLPLRDSDSVRVMPGVEFKPRALIKGSAYVGYRKFTPAEPDSAGSFAGSVWVSPLRADGIAQPHLPDFSGLVADLGLSYTMLGSTTFAVSYRRDLTYSYEELQPFFVANSIGASVRRALGRRFDVLVSADRYSYAYRNLVLPSGVNLLPLDDRVDTTWNYAASLGYRIGSGRIGFGASYWTRDSSTRPLRDYDNLRIGTTATYGF